MKRITYSDCVSQFISLGLKVKSKLHWVWWTNQFSLQAAMSLYLIEYFDKLDFASLVWTGTMFVFFLRMLAYMLSLHLFGSGIESLLEEINNERNNPLDSAEIKTTKESFAKIEFFIAVGLSVAIIVSFLFLIISVLFIKSNQFRLPYPFVIVFLSFDEVFSFNWLLNYIFQVITGFFACTLFIIYIPMILAIVIHCCLMFEELTIMTQSLRENPQENTLKSENKLKKFIEQSQVIFLRHEQAKSTVQFHFFIEFSMLSFVLCFSLYASLIETTLLSLVVVGVSLVQLFIFCFLGDQVNNQINRFEATVYDLEWYSTNATEQKEILFVLMKIRDTKGFNGIFNSVGMETFLQIVKFAYSMLMVLLSRQ